MNKIDRVKRILIIPLSIVAIGISYGAFKVNSTIRGIEKDISKLEKEIKSTSSMFEKEIKEIREDIGFLHQKSHEIYNSLRERNLIPENPLFEYCELCKKYSQQANLPDY